MSSQPIGNLVREWRTRRSRSQFDLAIDIGVSAKHLSFVETGKSRPSPELVLAIAQHLDVPLRDRNTMLLAAGFAPRFNRTALDDTEMTAISSALQRLLDAHLPYPGVVLDGHWNVLLANTAATKLAGVLPADLLAPLNMFRAGLHPQGFAAITTNFDEWGTYLLTQLHRLVQLSADPVLSDLESEVSTFPNVQELRARTDWANPLVGSPLLVPCRLDDLDMSFFTTLTTFGSPRDITLDELAVELFYPADDHTTKLMIGETVVLRGSGGTASGN